jgi:hypothetical protein
VIFTDRPTFEAVGSGIRTYTDFNGLVADELLPFDAGPFTITSTEPESLVDVLPPPFPAFDDVDIDGTPYLAVQVDITGVGESVSLSFDAPILMLGFEANPGTSRDSEGEFVSFATNGGESGVFQLPTTNVTGFRGFSVMNHFNSVTFSYNATGNNDEFTEYGMDNITTFSDTGEPIIPEPSTFIVWSLLGGLGIVGWWRRRSRAA